jgi:hypothetical protein
MAERALRLLVGIVLVVVLAVAVLWGIRLAGYGYLIAASQEKVTPVRPTIPFAPLTDTALHDPDDPTKTFRVDLAKVERDFPLTRAERAALVPANILALSQEEVDQLYARLTAGPIPDGPYLGDLFFARGETLRPRLEEIVGGIGGRVAGEKVEGLEAVGRSLWKGKMFYRDERVLRNFIEDLRPLRALIDDPDRLGRATVPREGLLRYVLPTTDVWLAFPAKLYCGQSLLDGRRESVIIDYAYGDELPGYQEHPDVLAGRNGLRIRDEIRMIRPGFYLGRAYADRIFLLNFILYNEAVAEAGNDAFARGDEVAEDCWPGEQERTAEGG